MLQYIPKSFKIITGIILALCAVSLVSCVISIVGGHSSDKIIRFTFEWYMTIAPTLVALLLLPFQLGMAVWNVIGYRKKRK